ncbi:MAG: retroviral-like aspartic protease family protein [Bacteroidaceae bacterium]|nr:retroviral-like aspartic protease family protein [Bacteroidaceae bacterium]
MRKYEFVNNGIIDKIISPVTVDIADYVTDEKCNDIYKNAKALWDTGSTVTVISSIMVQQLGLIPTDITTIRGFYGTHIKANTYNIDIWLNDIHIEYIQAIEGCLTNIDMILGMDVLCQGALHITHPNFTTSLVFEKE